MGSDKAKIAKAIIQLIDVVHYLHSKSITHGNINDKSIVFPSHG